MARFRLRVSEHAVVRISERLGLSRNMHHEIQGRLNTVLRLGAVPGPDLGISVLLGDGCEAICCPSEWGGWVVVTVLDRKFRQKGVEAS